jgi:phage shock protein A
MNLLERVLTLLRANLNSVVEKADDPEKALRQLQLDMRNQLVQVKTQVATAIAEGHKLQKRSQEIQAQANVWLKRAEQAVQQGNDTTAREALTHYNDINKQALRYQQQKKEQEQLVDTMRTALRQLEAKIAEVDTTIDLLVTRKRNALIQQRVFEALNKTGGTKEKAQATKAQDAVMEAEARARALAELSRRSIDTQLDELSDEQVIEQQLQDMKRSSSDTPLLYEGHAQTSPLLPPTPQSSESSRRNEPPRRRPAHAQTEPSTGKDLDLEQLKKLLDASQSQE